MLHKSYQTGMLPNLSNAALLGILWVTRFFTKSDLCHMLGIPVFNIGRWPPCLRRSSYAQAGGKLFQHFCLLDYMVFFATLGFILCLESTSYDNLYPTGLTFYISID